MVFAEIILLIIATFFSPSPHHELPPCPTEDSTINCYWDASEHGNGQGRDFVVYDGKVYYVKDGR